MQGTSIIFIAAAFVVGLAGTAAVRAYAQRAQLLDVPNQRSSHQTVTPRGGGLSIVIASFGIIVAHLLGLVPVDDVFFALLGAGSMVAVVGFIDDHRHVNALWRLLVQAAAAFVFLVMIGGMPAVQFGGSVADLGLFGDAAALVFIVWFTNLFNFMDGIDGIAAVETVCIAMGILLLPAVAASGATAFLLAALAAGTAGFLFWNWPPARIFMGDVGSSYIGFVLAATALVARDLEVTPIWPWLILGGVFIVDATVTLVRRMARGDSWYSAHRSHAYQRLSRRLESHLVVTLGLAAINAIWLFPLAYAAFVRPGYGWWLTIVAWTPLALAVIAAGSGRPDDDESDAKS